MRRLLEWVIRRREAVVSLLLIIWLVYGLTVLVRSETPRGRLIVRVVAQETGVPLPDAYVSFYQGVRRWDFSTGKDGTLELSAMPAGSYRVYASTRAHSIDYARFSLEEGERKEIVLALPPNPPFLGLIHPQPVFLPTEAVKIGLRGFIEQDELKMEIHRLRLKSPISNLKSQMPLGRLFANLDGVRYGWWQGGWEWEQRMERMKPLLEPVKRDTIPVGARDVEGVFTQYVPLTLREPGTYLVRFYAGALEQIALVMITEAGLIVKSVGDREIWAWTTHLEDGHPLGGTWVEAWADQHLQGRTPSRLLARAQAGPDGLARLNLTGSLDGIDQVYVIAYQGFRASGLQGFRGSGRPNLQVLSPEARASQTPKPETLQPVAWVSLWLGEEELETRNSKLETVLTGVIYSERPIYRPGHTVHYKGILRLHTSRGYELLPNGTPVTVLVRDPSNTLLSRAELRLNAFSSFAGSVRLSEEARTGIYTVSAQVGSQQVEGSFNIAAYRKPTFQVSLRPTRKDFTYRDLVRLELNARYYFGLPVGEAEVDYMVYRVPLMEGLEGEEVASPVEWEEEADYGEYVMSGETTTDENGRATITFHPTDFAEREETRLPFEPRPEYRYIVRAYVRAMGYEYAETEARFDVVQGDWRVALTSEPSFCQPGERVQVKVDVRHRETNAPQGASLQWRAGVMRWQGEEVQLEPQRGLSGSLQTNAQGEAAFEFTPSQVGDWLIEVETRDGRGNPIIVQTWLWVSRYGESLPRPPKAEALQLKTDKKVYQIGERAKIALRSRVQNATVLVTIEGDRLHTARLATLRGGIATLELPLGGRYVPSVYISACMVSRKRFVQQTLPIRIGGEGKQLQISVQSDRPLYEPRQTAQVAVQVRSAEGRPVRAELSLAVVDEAIYAIREEDPKLLFNTFYARRPNRVQTQYSFPWLALQGDKGEAETVRRYFPDTALWLPQIVTDANGFAHATLQVPDSLTQWRITAIGHTTDTRVGYGSAKFTCAKEFAVRLSAPMVATEGDEITLSAIVSNNGTNTRDATVELQTPTNLLRGQVRVPPGKSQTIEWEYRASGLQGFRASGLQRAVSHRLRFLVRARSRDGRVDAEEKTITFLPHAMERVSTQWRVLGSGSTVLNLQVPPSLLPHSSSLEVRLAPSVFSQMLGALDYLADYPYGCTEQTMSRFLPSLMVLRVLRERGIRLPRLEQQVPDMVQKSIARLHRFQHSDGGWGWWEDDPSDLWMTAYVLRGLTVAKRTGVSVNAEVLKEGSRALEHLIRAYWEQPRGDWDTFAFALYALASAGGPMPTTILLPRTPEERPVLQPMLPRPQNLTPYGKALLLLALTEWKAEANLRAVLLNELLRERRRTAEGIYWQRAAGRGQQTANWINAAETTAWVFLVLMRQSEIRNLKSEIVQWLLAQRREVGWQSTKDTAVVLEALLEYAKRYENREPKNGRIGKWESGRNPKSIVRIFLNGTPAGEVRFDARSVWNPEVVLSLPTDRLVVGNNTLALEVLGSSPIYLTLLFRQSHQLLEQPGEVLVAPRQLARRYSLVHALKSGEEGGQIEETPLHNGDTVPVGSLIRVRLRSTGWGGEGLRYMVLEDPLPAGCRPMEAELPGGEESYYEGSYYTREDRDDRVIAYFREVGGDTLEFEYLLRAESPGDYHILPPRLWSMYGDVHVMGSEIRLRVRE